MPDPIVSRAAADAYNLFPGVKASLPPTVIEGMSDLAELFDALADVDPTYPTRLISEGSPLTWPGFNEAVGKPGLAPGSDGGPTPLTP